MLEKALGPNKLWVAAYCNDVFGYLPSARVLAEGGYETRGLYYGGSGLFDAKAQDVLVSKVRELAGKAGGPAPSKEGSRTGKSTETKELPLLGPNLPKFVRAGRRFHGRRNRHQFFDVLDL